MIAVKIMAGLGNQMFQYAAARGLAFKRKTNVVLDISSYESMSPDDTPRSYELNLYPITASIATPSLLAKTHEPTSVKNAYVTHLGNWLRGDDITLLTYRERTAGYNKRLLQLPDNSYLVGWWQCPKYFDHIRDILLREFEPVAQPSKKNQRHLEKVNTTNSIAVHVRRGDLVSNKHAASHHGLTSLEYYSQAIEYMQQHVSSPTFFVFSDDIEWCKTSLPLPKNSVFVEGNDGEKAYEDLRIMKNCKHNIIANSSFSWWGAWLNSYEGKIVIAPKTWFQNTEANREIDIVPSDWIRF